MERRNFIKSSCLTCMGSIGAMWLLEACSTSKQLNNYEQTQNKITIKKTEFIVTKKDKPTELKYIVLKPDSLYFPIAVYKLDNNEYKTLFLNHLFVQTMEGCLVGFDLF